MVDIVINTSKEEVWDLTFNRFGEVNLFNPVIEGSHSISEQKGVGCERQCDMDSKGTHVLERITDSKGHESFDIEIIGGNMPMIDKATATWSFTELGPNKTRARLDMKFNTKPAFMWILMSFMMKGMLTDMTKGLKYYMETGETVSKGNIKAIKRAYAGLSEGQAFTGLG